MMKRSTTYIQYYSIYLGLDLLINRIWFVFRRFYYSYSNLKSDKRLKFKYIIELSNLSFLIFSSVLFSLVQLFVSLIILLSLTLSLSHILSLSLSLTFSHRIFCDACSLSLSFFSALFLILSLFSFIGSSSFIFVSSSD